MKRLGLLAVVALISWNVGEAETRASELLKETAGKSTAAVKAGPSATHQVYGTWLDKKGETWLALRTKGKGDKAAEVIAKLPDGTQLAMIKDRQGKKKRWMEVVVTSGPDAGKQGLVHGNWVQKLLRPNRGPKTPEELLDSVDWTDPERAKSKLFDAEVGLLVYSNTAGALTDDVELFSPSKARICGRAFQKMDSDQWNMDMLMGWESCTGHVCVMDAGHFAYFVYFKEHQGRLIVWMIADVYGGLVVEEKMKEQERSLFQVITQERNKTCKRK